MKKFVTKPADDLIGEVEQWLDLNDNGPVRIEVDEVYHLIHDADNVLMLEAVASGEKRMDNAIEELRIKAEQVAPLFNFDSGDMYLLKIIDSPESKLFMEEIAAVSDMISSLQKKADIAWGFSHQEGIGDVVILRLAVKNLQSNLH